MHDHGPLALDLAADLSRAAGLLPVYFGLFSVGLAGSFSHCIGMCGPFVMAQVAADPGSGRGGAVALVRAGGGILIPYHLGRLTTYALLGALAGGSSAFIVRATSFQPILVGLLALGALLFLVQGLHGLGRRWPALARIAVPRSGLAGRLGMALSKPLAPLFARPGGMNGYLLGLVLGFLPCGLLYATLASAAGLGSAPAGFLAMAAFALGTVPGLVAVGMLGSVAGSRFAETMRALAPALMLFNAGVLALMAWHALG